MRGQHIRKRGRRKDGSTVWQAQYTDPANPKTKSGGTNRIAKTFRRREDAEDWLAQQRAAVLWGEHIDPRRAEQSFGVVADAWRRSWGGAASLPRRGAATSPSLRRHLLPEFGTGLRAGGPYGLHRRDVELDKARLHVRRALKEINSSHLPAEDKGFQFGPPKTPASRRTVALPKFLVAMLRGHLEPDPDALVFTTPKGCPVRQTLFYARYFKPAVRVALPHKPKVGLDDLRHTCVALLVEQSAHPN